MQFIRQDVVEAAFMTMMNKLAYATGVSSSLCGMRCAEWMPQ